MGDIMGSVTSRIREVKQPKGGYINPNDLEIIKLDGEELSIVDENIHPALVGLAVDYMTRFMVFNNKNDAFSISFLGATIINDLDKAEKLLDGVIGLDDNSIINACKLCGYDVCYRSSPLGYKNVDDINPDEKTVNNIRIMINRSISFFEKYGPVIDQGITFDGAYTDLITIGDADFITKDTLWDFKVSKSKPLKEYTLQLLIYYLLGIHSPTCDFTKIQYIGIFNPRLNTIYKYKISDIPKEIIEEVEEKVIGYKKIAYDRNSDLMTIPDIMKELKCSRNTVMKYYTYNDLPLRKENNKYVIKRSLFYLWLKDYNYKAEQGKLEKVKTLIVVLVMLVIIIIVFAVLSLH